jgi:outer membrane protein assembly factor BamA
VPYYKETRIGGVNTVRGWPQGFSQGTHALVGTVEYRPTLVSKQRLALPWIGHCDLTVGSVVFIDAGMTWSGPPAREHLLIGSGLGLRFFAPLVDAIRIDYAWNRDLEGRWQIESGVKL